MEIKEKTIYDYCSDITLHNNHVLICAEGEVSSLELSSLLVEKGKDNSAVSDKFFKELGKAPKILVKTSTLALKNCPELTPGDLISFNTYGNPKAIFVEEDPFELDNLLDDYKVDKKDPKFMQNTIGIKYKVRCYYTFEASAIILTKKQ